jgi:D-arabinose 1-dehydrogenase-like Zn-dependent alcohol dehydrogenase
MATMIAARLHAYGSPMTLDRIEVPEPRPTDVLVEVKACGVVPNLARVVSNFFGSLTPDNKMMPPLPAIFGLDPTGVVAKVGAQVFSIRPGDRVYVNPVRSCGSCKMCRSGKELDCPSFTLQGYFGRSQDIMRAYPYGGLAQFITAPAGAMMRALFCLRRGGRAVNVGAVLETLPLNAFWMMTNRIGLQGSVWFTTGEGEEMAAMAGAGTLDLSALEHRVSPLSKVNEVLAGMDARDGGFTNFVIDPTRVE